MTVIDDVTGFGTGVADSFQKRYDGARRHRR